MGSSTVVEVRIPRKILAFVLKFAFAQVIFVKKRLYRNNYGIIQQVVFIQYISKLQAVTTLADYWKLNPVLLPSRGVPPSSNSRCKCLRCCSKASHSALRFSRETARSLTAWNWVHEQLSQFKLILIQSPFETSHISTGR